MLSLIIYCGFEFSLDIISVACRRESLESRPDPNQLFHLSPLVFAEILSNTYI
jgi:hypothetical protein